MTTPLRQALLARCDAHKSWSRAVASRRSGRLGRNPARVAARAVLRDGAAVSGHPRPDQASPMTARQTSGALAAAARLEVREVAATVRVCERDHGIGIVVAAARGADAAR